MATTFHQFAPPSTLSLPKHIHPQTKKSNFTLKHPMTNPRKTPNFTLVAQSYKVLMEHEGVSTEIDVEPDETILSKAMELGLSVPHDCKLGVCMTCPARLVSGTVDQSEGMLSDDVVERGFALLCVAYPTSDCHVKTIPEEELLALQLVTAND